MQSQKFIEPDNPLAVSAQQVVYELFQSAETRDIAALDRIYHDNLEVIMVSPEGETSVADKPQFMGQLRDRLDSQDEPFNTWVQFHRVDADEEKALLVLSRINDLAGRELHIDLTIELVNERERWQILREVLFFRELPLAA